MKAVIVDLLDGQAAALRADGRVVKLADAGYTLGQTLELHEKRRAPRLLRYASAAAAVLLLAGAGGGAAYAMPYGVVSLDVNPSLEYTINRFDYVLRVDGVNEDGKALLAEMDAGALVHRPITAALEASVRQLEAAQLLAGEDDEIVIAAGTKKSDHAERLLSTLEDDLRRENLAVRALAVSEADIDAAHQAGMSAGRRQMLNELRESEGADFEPDAWAARPIRDILHRLENGPESEAENRPEAVPQDAPQAKAQSLPENAAANAQNSAALPPEPQEQPGDPRPAMARGDGADAGAEPGRREPPPQTDRGAGNVPPPSQSSPHTVPLAPPLGELSRSD